MIMYRADGDGGAQAPKAPPWLRHCYM